MVLVNYSDSDTDTDPNTSKAQQHDTTSNPSRIRTSTTPSINPRLKRKADDNLTKPGPPPPLPPSFHTLYSTPVRTSTTDDPTLHGGRKRQVVHTPGNWATHIYLEWLPDTAQLTRLDSLIQQARHITTKHTSQPLHSFLRTHLGARLPLHISLSAPLVLSTERKTSFRDRFCSEIGRAKVGKLVVEPVAVDLVSNWEGSRSFLVLRVRDEARDGGLRGLLDVCNAVCREFGVALLYESEVDGGGVVTKSDGQDAFHVSVAWILGVVSQDVKDDVAGIELGVLGQSVLEFDRVKIKIGNVVEDVLL